MSQSSATLREQLVALVQLQGVDRKIDALETRKTQLPRKLAEISAAIAEKKKGLELREKERADIEKASRQAQAAIELNQDRLQRAEKKLEGITNQSEFHAANKEVEQLKKFKEELEQQATTILAGIEQVDAAMGEIKKAIEELDAQRASQEEGLRSESEKLNSELTSLHTGRDAQLKKLDRALVARYDRVRKARGGIGTVAAVDGRCRGCNMMLPPQFFNQVLKVAEIESCPTCQRILHLPDMAGPNPESGLEVAQNQ